MSTDPFDFDDVSDEDHESQDCLTSLSSALTEHHHNTNYEGPFTLKTTTNTSYVSHSDAEGLSSDEVGRLLGSELTPWGLDWIGMSFPVASIVVDPPFPWIELQSNGAKWTQIWKTSFEIGQGAVELKVTKKGNSLSGYLSFNPTSCMYGPKSLYVAAFDDALYVAGLVLDAVDEWLTPGCVREAMLLSRLDVNVTVEPVTDIQRLLSIVKNVFTRGVTPLATYGKGGRLETVVCRSKRSGGFCVYDKGLQAGLDRSAVRFEVNARRCRLREICPTLGDLTKENLRRIAGKTLQPVIDSLMQTPRNAVADIFAVKKESTVFIEMVGLATLADLGHHPHVSPYALRKKYRPILKKYSARTVGDLLN
jgi:hypothetical protein